MKRRIHDYRFLLFALLAFILIHRLYYFNCFYVPDADFFDFREKAISFLNLQLPQRPQSYERLPFYSVLMGFLSLVLPGKEPILSASELINLISFIVSLFLVYSVSSKFLRISSSVVVLLFSMHPLTTHMTVQPRAEMLTLMLILLGTYLSFRDNSISYLFGFLAALTRYEGVILIVSLVIKDLIFSKRKGLAILLGFLSSLGVIVWLSLNFKATGHLNPYYHYFGRELGSTTFKDRGLGTVSLQYIKSNLAVLLNFISLSGSVIKKSFATLILLLGTSGFYFLFKKSLERTLLIFLLFIGHLLIHLVYYTPAEQHSFLILWISYLVIMGGIEGLLEFIIDKAPHNPLAINTIKTSLSEVKTKTTFYLLVLVIITGYMLLAGFGTPYNQPYVFWVAYIMYCPITLWFITIAVNTGFWLNRLLIFVGTPVLSFIVGKDILLTQERMEKAIYIKAELRQVGEWYTQNSKGEKIVVTEPRVAGYYADLLKYSREPYISYKMPVSGHYSDNYGNFIFLGSLNASSYESFITELRNKEITYLVWNSHHGRYPQNYYYYKKDKIFLISGLSQGQDNVNFKLIKTIKVGSSYAFIYRFVP